VVEVPKGGAAVGVGVVKVTLIKGRDGNRAMVEQIHRPVYFEDLCRSVLAGGIHEIGE